ncbi:hypothetical protein IP69_11460 [Bosea sp. AAP35]|nr:hypothetical protein IP69_11460 [Bosea sp. AAP35]
MMPVDVRLVAALAVRQMTRRESGPGATICRQWLDAPVTELAERRCHPASAMIPSRRGMRSIMEA